MMWFSSFQMRVTFSVWPLTVLRFKFIETWPLADDVYTFHSIHDSSNVLCGVNDILFSLFCDNGY
jgi:hypothetical protein